MRYKLNSNRDTNLAPNIPAGDKWPFGDGLLYAQDRFFNGCFDRVHDVQCAIYMTMENWLLHQF